MNKLLILLIAISSFSTFSGVLSSKKGLGQIEFSVDVENNIIHIDSGSSLLKSKSIYYRSIDPKESSIELLGFTNKMNGCEDCGPEWGLYPILAALDLVSLPVKGIVKLVKNKQFKQDYLTLIMVVNSPATIVVSKNRFRRIVKLLKHKEVVK